MWRKIRLADVFEAPASRTAQQRPRTTIEPWLNRPWFCSAENRPDTGQEPRSSSELGRQEQERGLQGVQPLRPPARPLRRREPCCRPGARQHSDVHDLRRPRGGRRLEPQRPLGEKVYSREWGRFIVRNGLLAYTLMQAWGNDPAHFATDEPGTQAARRHAGRVARHGAHAGDDRRPRHTARLRLRRRPSPSGSRFNFTVKAQDHSVVVLDTRTHRDVSNLTLEPPNLVDNLDEQLPERPATTRAEGARRRLARARVRPGRHRAARPAAGPARHRQQARDATSARSPGSRRATSRIRKRGRVRQPRRAWRREVRPRGMVGERAGLRGPARPARQLPGRRDPVGRRPLRSTIRLDCWTQRGDEPARLVQCTSSASKNVFKGRSRRSSARSGTSSGPRRCRSSGWRGRTGSTPTELIPSGARLPLARRSRLRKRPALVPKFAGRPARSAGGRRASCRTGAGASWPSSTGHHSRPTCRAGLRNRVDPDDDFNNEPLASSWADGHGPQKRVKKGNRRCCGGSCSSQTSAPFSSSRSGRCDRRRAPHPHAGDGREVRRRARVSRQPPGDRPSRPSRSARTRSTARRWQHPARTTPPDIETEPPGG